MPGVQACPRQDTGGQWLLHSSMVLLSPVHSNNGLFFPLSTASPYLRAACPIYPLQLHPPLEFSPFLCSVLPKLGEGVVQKGWCWLNDSGATQWHAPKSCEKLEARSRVSLSHLASQVCQRRRDSGKTASTWCRQGTFSVRGSTL